MPCVPSGSEARRLLDEVTLTAPELGSLALRIADHLDGLALAGKAGLQQVPMAGIVLHTALGELLRYPQDDPWEQAATFYRGLWMAVDYHLARVRVETPASGIWASRRPVRLRDVLAGQERCTIAWLEEGTAVAAMPAWITRSPANFLVAGCARPDSRRS